MRWHLVDAIASGRLQGAALDIDGRIVAVAAWMLDEEDETVWRSSLVAVRDGHANRGHGRRMKQHVVDLARAASARAVVSVVHRDNQAMWRINERFGAVFAPMDRLLDYFTATIVLS